MTGSRSSTAARRRAGFTLLEILMVLALGALIAGLLVSGSDSLLRAAQREDMENSALAALASARRDAVMADETLELRSAPDGRRLDWGRGREELTGEGSIRLLPMTTDSSVLIAGRKVENAVAGVRFYADGTCDPFRLEILRGGTSRILTVDPWTCAVLADAPRK